MNKSIQLAVACGLSLLLAACSSTGGSQSGDFGSVGDGGGAGGGLNGSAYNGTGSFYGADAGGMSEQELLAVHTYYFSYDSSNVVPEHEAAIIAQAHFLANHPNKHILLAGNTDDRGSREYNIALGWRRAQSVQKLMLVNGASRDQMRLVSYGEEKPASFGDSEQSYTTNRRVDLTFES